MRKPDENKEWLAGIRQGDARAFHQVHQEYYKALVFYAYKIVGTMPEAEDIVADSFTKLFLSRDRIKNSGHVKEFLYRVTRNASIDRVRVQGREKQLRKELTHLAENDPVDLNDFGVVQADLVSRIHKEIENLPDRGRQVLKLYLEEKTTSEIAEALHINSQTVLNHKSSALKWLRSKLPF